MTIATAQPEKLSLLSSSFNLAPHQERMVARAFELNGNVAYLAEPRTGKTAAALAYLIESGCQRILVVCPSIAAGVWRAEARRVDFPLPLFIALDGNLTKRAEALKSWIALHPASVIVINYQGFWREKIFPILMNWKPDAIVSDECSGLRGRNTKQSKAAFRLGQLPSVRSRLGLTGTPITNSVQDIFGIYRFVNPSVFGTRWKTFADEFLTFGFWGEVKGSRNDDEIKRRIDSVSIQVSRSEAWGGLPKRLDQVWPVLLSEESSKRYKKFAKEAIVAVEGTDVNGNLRRGTVSADLVITQIARLQGLLSGHTKLDGELIDVSSEKIDAAVELTQQAIENDESVVIFAAFRREIARIYMQLSQLFPNKVAVIQGGDDPEKRIQNLAQFKKKELRILILQNRIGSMAIDLAVASLAIVMSSGWSLEDFLQGRERLTGVDPNRSFSYVYLQAEHSNGGKTIDAKIYSLLQAKQRIAGQFLSLDYTKQLFAEG